MASSDKLWFELGVREQITQKLDAIIKKADDVAKSLLIIGKEPLVPGVKDGLDNLSKLEKAIANIRGKLSELRSLRIKVTDPQDLAEINRIQLALGKMRERINRFKKEAGKNIEENGLAEGFLSIIGYDTAMAQVTQRVGEFSRRQRDVSQATRESARSNYALVESYDQVVAAGKRTNNVLEQMKVQIGSALSLWGVEKLLKDVVQIGGQFEVQHIAMQSILGDIEQANSMFEQMKRLAVVSPFNFSQLAKYTKQVAAFGIPYEELYDTTKRLADMSAGLGVDMGRLILAYGQVRSAAVLRGQELRQFTEAGIPMVKALAEEFTKLNGEVVTTGDVFKLISKRAVPFEMVKKVMWDMTEEGGRFYNMQFVLSDTLAGKWSNLRDAWEIMLSDFAKGSSMSGQMLKGMVQGLTTLIENIDKIAPLISATILTFTSHKFLSGLSDNAIFNLKGVDARIAKAQKLNAIKIRERYIQGEINAKEMQGALQRNKDINLWRTQLALAGRMNGFHLMHLDYKKKENKELLKQLVLMQAMDQKTANMFLSGQKLTGAFRMVGASIKSALGPIGWGMIAMDAVVAIGTAMWMSWQKTNDQMKEANDTFISTAKDRRKELEDTLSGYEKSEPSNDDGYKNAIEAMKEQLKQYDANYAGVMREVDGISSLRDKYDLLKKELGYVKEAYDMAARSKESFEDVQDGTKELRHQADEWTKSTGEMEVAITKLAAKGSEKIEEFLKKVAELNPEMRKAVYDENGTFAGAQKALKWMSDNLSGAELEAINASLQGNQLLRDGKYVDKYNSIWKYLDDEDQEMWETYFKNYRSRASRYESQIAPLMEKVWASSIEQTAAEIGIKADELEKKLEKEGNNVDQRTKTLLLNFYREQMNAITAGNQDFARWVDSQRTTLRFHFDIVSDYAEQKDELQGGAARAWNKIGGEGTNEYGFPNRNKKKNGFTKQDIKNAFGETGNDYVAGAKYLNDEVDKSETAWKATKKAYEKGIATAEEVEDAKSEFDDKLSELVQIAPRESKLKNNKKGTGGSKKDTLLESAKTRLEEVKEFYAEYKKYREQYGAEKGLSMVEDIFGVDHSKAERIVGDYKTVLEEILESVPQDTEARKKFAIGLKKLLADIDIDATKNELQKSLREIERYIQDETSKWNLYKNLLDKTGSKEFAMKAFVDDVVWDDVSRSMAERLKEGMAKRKLSFADSIFDMDQDEAEKFFGKNSAELKLWEEIVKSIRKNWTDGLNDIAEATSKLMTTEDKIVKAERELAELRGKYGKDDPRVIAKEREIKQLHVEAFEQSEPYVRFYSSIFAMTADEAENMGAKIKANLVDQLAKGEINADKYLKSIKNVNQQLEKMREVRSDAMTLMTQGYRGLLDKRTNVYESQASDAALKLEKAEKDLEKARKEGNEMAQIKAKVDKAIAEKELSEAQKKLGWTEESLKQANNLLSIMEMISGALDGMAKAAEQMSEMFDALGHQHTANTWSDIADVISAVSSPVNAATNALKSAMTGDVGGVISNTVGVFTSPITAFAKLHDKKLQRQIEESEMKVKSLTTAYGNLQTAMERALGGIYTTGGYEEMYDNLKKQRDELARQYDSESRKKKSDAGKLADYEEQLREADETMKNYALDMAKSLYEIDLQGWASQLTDAIVGAWEKGEDAAEAYREKVKDLMKDLTKNILAKKVMEKAFANLGIDEIIANMMDASSGRLDETAIPRLAEALGQAGDLTVDAITKTLDAMEANGTIEREASSSKSSTSNTIKGITENTADLLASYINAIRADVSVNRMTLTEILSAVQGQSELPVIAQAQLLQLEQISSNTLRNALAAEMIYDILHSNVLGNEKFNVK